MTYYAQKTPQKESPPLDDWDDDEPKPNMLLVWSMGIGIVLLILGGLGSLTLYFIPKAVGDTFTDRIAMLQLQQAATYICEETSPEELRQMIQGERSPEDIRDPINIIMGRGMARGVVKVNSSYNPFNSEYTFRLELTGNAEAAGIRVGAGVASAPITLKITRNVFGFSACVAGT